MKILIASAVCAAVLTGCAAGAVDSRMYSVPREIVEVDGLPVYVAVVPVDATGTLYDVEAGEGRAFSFGGGLNEPLVYQARFRKAAMLKLQQRFGPSAKLAIVSEHAPTGYIKLFMRFSVTPA